MRQKQYIEVCGCNEKGHQEVLTTSYAINSKECNSQKQLSLTPGLHLQLVFFLVTKHDVYTVGFKS